MTSENLGNLEVAFKVNLSALERAEKKIEEVEKAVAQISRTDLTPKVDVSVFARAADQIRRMATESRAAAADMARLRFVSDQVAQVTERMRRAASAVGRGAGPMANLPGPLTAMSLIQASDGDPMFGVSAPALRRAATRRFRAGGGERFFSAIAAPRPRPEIEEAFIEAWMPGMPEFERRIARAIEGIGRSGGAVLPARRGRLGVGTGTADVWGVGLTQAPRATDAPPIPPDPYGHWRGRIAELRRISAGRGGGGGAPPAAAAAGGAGGDPLSMLAAAAPLARPGAKPSGGGFWSGLGRGLDSRVPGFSFSMLMGAMEVASVYSAMADLRRATNVLPDAAEQLRQMREGIAARTSTFGTSGIAALLATGLGLTHAATGYRSFGEAFSTFDFIAEEGRRSAEAVVKRNAVRDLAVQAGVLAPRGWELTTRHGLLARIGQAADASEAAARGTEAAEDQRLQAEKENLLNAIEEMASAMRVASRSTGFGTAEWQTFRATAMRDLERWEAGQRELIERRRGLADLAHRTEVENLRATAAGLGGDNAERALRSELEAAMLMPEGRERARAVERAEAAIEAYDAEVKQSRREIEARRRAFSAGRAGRESDAAVIAIDMALERAKRTAPTSLHGLLEAEAAEQKLAAREDFARDRRIRERTLQASIYASAALTDPRTASAAPVYGIEAGALSALELERDPAMRRLIADEARGRLRLLQAQMFDLPLRNGFAGEIDPTLTDLSGTNARRDEERQLAALNAIRQAIQRVEAAVKQITPSVTD